MGALINPCVIAETPDNTGVECSVSMGVPTIIVMLPANAKWTANDELDFYTYLLGKVHAAAGSRWYPLFGRFAPINGVTNNKENDVIETLEDGSQTLIRKGMYTRTFMTTKGGECLAKALGSLDRAGYSFIEIDKDNNVKRMKNADGTFSGIPTNLAYAPTPDLADFKASYKNSFLLNFSPKFYIDRGSIANCDTDLSDVSGLLDFDLSVGNAGASSTTKLKFQAFTECAQTDLVALLGNTLAQTSNFVVTKVSDGTTVSIASAAIVNGHVELTGTFTSTASYIITPSAAATLYANNVVGFEGKNTLTIAIP